jgi:hypothetical protein
MKKCSSSLAIKEIQIKTSLKFYLTPVRMAIIKIKTITNVEADVETKEPAYTVGGNIN